MYRGEAIDNPHDIDSRLLKQKSDHICIPTPDGPHDGDGLEVAIGSVFALRVLTFAVLPNLVNLVHIVPSLQGGSHPNQVATQT